MANAQQRQTLGKHGEDLIILQSSIESRRHTIHLVRYLGLAHQILRVPPLHDLADGHARLVQHLLNSLR